jgi:hypothetical protein
MSKVEEAVERAMSDAAIEAANRIEAMSRQLVECRAALEPFALLAGGDVNMNDPLRKWFTVAHLQAAAKALEGSAP